MRILLFRKYFRSVLYLHDSPNASFSGESSQSTSQKPLNSITYIPPIGEHQSKSDEQKSKQRNHGFDKNYHFVFACFTDAFGSGALIAAGLHASRMLLDTIYLKSRNDGLIIPRRQYFAMVFNNYLNQMFSYRVSVALPMIRNPSHFSFTEPAELNTTDETQTCNNKKPQNVSVTSISIDSATGSVSGHGAHFSSVDWNSTESFSSSSCSSVIHSTNTQEQSVETVIDSLKNLFGSYFANQQSPHSFNVQGCSAAKAERWSEAVSFWTKSANLNHPPAQYNLGVWFACPLDKSSPSPRKAEMWFQRAVGAGHPEAAFNLAIILARRENLLSEVGDPEIREEVIGLLTSAVTGGVEEADSFLNKLYAVQSNKRLPNISSKDKISSTSTTLPRWSFPVLPSSGYNVPLKRSSDMLIPQKMGFFLSSPTSSDIESGYSTTEASPTTTEFLDTRLRTSSSFSHVETLLLTGTM